MNREELKEVLTKHQKWLRNEEDGERANLRGAGLRGADLRGADLRGAGLRGADLCGADLRDAVLCCADLCDADLCGADLRGAGLRGADLCDANLCDANLRGADLCDANLRGADSRDADLRGADLRGADLRGADLRGADLRDADLCEKEQIRKGIIVQNKLTGWKKCQNGVLVKLEIPKDAIVFCINGSKCRTNVAKIVKVEGGDGKEAISTYDRNFVYKLGKTIKINDFNCIYNVECSTGIHFFRTKKEASEYNG